MRAIVLSLGLLALPGLVAADPAESCAAPSRPIVCAGQLVCVEPGASCCDHQICARGQLCTSCAGQFVCAAPGSACCGGSLCGRGERCVAKAGTFVCTK